VVYFAESGGTTARSPKRFALTASYERQVRGVVAPFMHRVARRQVVRYGRTTRRIPTPPTSL